MNKKIIQPIDAVVGINYVCNSRCKMCDIWKNKSFPEIPAEEYRKLPETLKYINISGGEPFLRKDIVKVIKVIRETCPKAKMVISTNGFMPALVESQMKKILEIDPDIGVAISIDGVGEMHEQIRRIPDAYNKSIDTLERLKKLGMKNLRFGFTIMSENLEHFSRVYDDAISRGVQFTHSFAQSSENYFGGIQNENKIDTEKLKKEYQYIIFKELKSWNIKRWLRAYFSFSLFKFITSKKQALGNDPGNRFFYIASNGIVFPSVVDNFPMGNIEDFNSWDELWSGGAAEKARKDVEERGQPAWMICTARTAMKKYPLKVGFWILKNKFRKSINL